ncbi:MAG: serine hydrolase [Saprospiraceae bacterium]
MKTPIFLLSFLFYFLSCQSPTERPLTQIKENIVIGEEGKRLDSLLTPYVKALRMLTDNKAALAIGVTNGKEILYARTFGYADVGQKIKADFNTAFHIASVSKPFSAVAIVKLVQEGKLKLDDKIVDHIPEFEMKDDRFSEITIRHILSHTSGIPRNIAVDDWLNPSYGVDAVNENLEILQEKELDFKPGEKFSYSNSAFDLLGVVISRASGMPFDEYLSTAVLEPAGMTGTGFKKSKDGFPSNWATANSYSLTTEQLTPYPYNERLFPSSGVVTTLPDMCRWGMIHLGKGKNGDYELLEEKYFDLLLSPQFDTPWEDEIALSWFLQSYLNRPIIMHTGFDTGFEAMMYIYPKDDYSIIVMANRDFSRTARIINATSEILFNKEPKSYNLSARYKFAEVYKKDGLEKARELWSEMKKDTTDNYYVDDEDILTTGAILENSKHWKQSKEILEYYLTLDEKSTYAWRLLGNANLNIGDTMTAKSCYQQTLKINPNYEKGRLALEQLED